jgi:small conductance mechanosensitive channel
MDVTLPVSNQVTRVLFVVGVVLVAHLLVYIVRTIGNKIQSSQVRVSLSKTRTVASLATSAVIFVLYFSAIGFVLTEFGVSLTAYLASASILGLAMGPGSQGLVLYSGMVMLSVPGLNDSARAGTIKSHQQ